MKKERGKKIGRGVDVKKECIIVTKDKQERLLDILRRHNPKLDQLAKDARRKNNNQGVENEGRY